MFWRICAEMMLPIFDIPENWRWIDLLTVVTTIPDKSYQIQQNAILHEGLYPVVSQSKNNIEGYCNQADKLLQHNIPLLVFGDHSKTIKYVDFDFVVGADGTKILYPFINAKFLYYCIMSNINKLPTKSYGRHFGLLSHIPIALPSLEEQGRIVSKLEQILPFVQDLS